MIPAAEWLEAGVVRVTSALPTFAKRLLVGGRRTRIDGQELDPDVELALMLLRLSGHRGLDTMTVVEARAELARSARQFSAGAPVMASVEPRTIPGPARPLPARLYVPRDPGPAPGLLVYYHGGGWVTGDLETHDAACRFLARELDLPLVAVDYRRAPEDRFPAAVDDALAAFRWAIREPSALGAATPCVAVAGDSAGGNLAAVVAQLAARDGDPAPAAQLLIYPVTDVSTKHPSYRLFADGFFLTEAEMDWYRRHYLPDEAAARDPRASPLLAPDARGLAPAVVLTAGFDVLRDEGEAYAQRLREAGVRVRAFRHAGLIHGFCNATGLSGAAAAAMRGAARALREAMGLPPRGA